MAENSGGVRPRRRREARVLHSAAGGARCLAAGGPGFGVRARGALQPPLVQIPLLLSLAGEHRMFLRLSKPLLPPLDDGDGAYCSGPS